MSKFSSYSLDKELYVMVMKSILTIATIQTETQPNPISAILEAVYRSNIWFSNFTSLHTLKFHHSHEFFFSLLSNTICFHRDRCSC